VQLFLGVQQFSSIYSLESRATISYKVAATHCLYDLQASHAQLATSTLARSADAVSSSVLMAGHVPDIAPWYCFLRHMPGSKCRTDTGSRRRPISDVLPGRWTFVHVSWARVLADRRVTHIAEYTSLTQQRNSHVFARLNEVTGIFPITCPRGSAERRGKNHQTDHWNKL
jgi:hypothetical protein